jgi:hypothetical protein
MIPASNPKLPVLRPNCLIEISCLVMVLSGFAVSALSDTSIRDIRFYQRAGEAQRSLDRPSLLIPQAQRQFSKLGEDPSFWSQAQESPAFVTMGNTEAASRTKAWFQAGDKHLFIAVDCYEDRWDELVTNIEPAEGDAHQAWKDDCLEVFIDPNHDQQSYYWITITAAGAVEDAKASAPEKLDFRWDGAYPRTVGRDPDKWRVELAIPFEALGWSRPPSSTFGLNIVRHKLTRPAGYTALSPTFGPNHVPGRFADARLALEFEGEAPTSQGDRKDDALELGVKEPLTQGEIGELIVFKDEYLGDESIVTGHLSVKNIRQSGKNISVRFEVLDGIDGSRIAAGSADHERFGHAFFEIGIQDLPAGEYEVVAHVALDDVEQGSLAARFRRSTALPRPDVSERSVELILDDVVEGRKAKVPVSLGVPMPRGILWETSRVDVRDLQGNPVPHQSRLLASWTKEGSVKWLGLDFLADSAPGTNRAYQLRFGEHVVPFESEPIAREEKDRILIDNGPLKMAISKGSPRIADWIEFRGQKIVERIDGLIRNQAAREFRGSQARSAPLLSLEENGPVKCVVRMETPYADADGRTSCSQITRVTAYRDQPFLAINHTFVFTEDSNETQLNDISLEIPLSIGRVNSVRFDVSPEHDGEIFSVTERLHEAPVFLHQQEAVRYGEGKNRFLVSRAGEPVHTGNRAGHWCEVSDGAVSMVAAVRHLWQQYPKEFEFRSGPNPSVHIHLWSGRDGTPLDFRTDAWVQRRGKWGKNSEDHWRKHANQAFGVAKTHEIFLYFYETEGTSPQEAEAFAETFERPVLAYCDPKWVTRSEVFGKFHFADRENFPREEEMLERVILNIDRNFSQGVDVGFIDYGLSPRMEVTRVEGVDKWLPSVYRFNADYGLTQYLWRAFARDPRRDYLELVTRSSHFRHDIGMCHANGLGKRAGEYNYWGFPWPPPGENQVGRNFMFHINFAILEYYLRGYDRAAEVARTNGRRMKECWDFDGWPEADGNINGERRSRIACMRECIDLYQLTWDDTFLLMAREMFEAVSRPDEPGGFRPSTVYAGAEEMDPVIPIYSKHEYAAFDFSEYESFTRTDEARRSLRKQFDYFYHVYGYTSPFDNIGWWWNMPLAYWATKDPKVLAFVRHMNELLIDYVDHYQDNPRMIWRFTAAANSVISGVGYVESVLLEGRAVETSVPYYGHGREFFLLPPDDGPLRVDISGYQPRYHEPDFLPSFYLASGEQIPAERIRIEPYSNKGYSKQYHWIEVDVPDPEKTIRMTYPSTKATSIRHTNARKVVTGIRGGEILSRLRGGRYYFFVPANTRTFAFATDRPKSFQVLRPDDVEAPLDPDRKRNTITVPEEFDGKLWRLIHQPVEEQGNFAWLQGVPEVVAFFDPDLFFVPDSVSVVPPRQPQGRSQEAYATGVTGEPQDRSLNLVSGRGFSFPRGERLGPMSFEHLDLNQGTLEFWFRPAASSFEAPGAIQPWFSSTADGSGLVLSAQAEQGRTRVGVYWRTEKGREWRDYPSKITRNDQWSHFALQWEHRGSLLYYDVYFDGEKMRISGGDTLDVRRHGPAPLAEPGEDLYVLSSPDKSKDPHVPPGRVYESLLDELRISDIPRYEGNFITPEKRFRHDDNSLALFHFDEDAEGIGAGGRRIRAITPAITK